jgi:uncharacterized ParB-like nuclease family protein
LLLFDLGGDSATDRFILANCFIMKKRVAVPIESINRPHESVIDEGKVDDLIRSIKEIGLQEPIDLIEFEGRFYGFNGCHRYTAHKRLGRTTIEANIRQVDRATFRLHLM